MSINSVVITGRLGSDPDVKYFDNNKVKASFNLAVDNPYKKDEPDWVTVVAWGQSATTIANYVRKGHSVGVVGRLETQSWDDRHTGEKRSRLVVNADRIDLMTTKREAEAMAASQQPYQQTQPPQAATASDLYPPQPVYSQPMTPTAPNATAGLDDDDIPF
jgi:single-strand DNA-binding protein